MKASQMTHQGRKKNLVSITFAEGAYKVNMIVDSEGQGIN